MAKEDVNIKVSADMAEVIQAWKEIEKGPEGLAKSLEGMGKRGQTATKGIGDEVTGMIGRWTTAGAAIAAVTKAIEEQYESMKKLRELQSQTTDSVDEVFNRFQVQSGMTNGPASDKVRNQLLGIIANRKADPIQGLQAAEALGSAGASVDDITGGGLDEFLKLSTATNAAGKEFNQAELAKAMVMFLEANGKKPNREGMHETSLAIQQLFGNTNLQLDNLNRFAGDAATIKNATGMSDVQQLAAFSQFLGTKDEAMASTAFRSGALSLRTAGATTEKKRALKMLGLNPEDVDFQGEDYYTAAGRLQQGFASVKPEQRDIAAKLLFGDEGMGFYNVLLQPGAVEETKKRVAMAQDPKGAAERLKQAESSRAAAARQAATLAALGQYHADADAPTTVQDRLKGLVGVLGMPQQSQATILGEFEDPGGSFVWDALYDNTDAGKSRRAARQIGGSTPLGVLQQQFPGEDLSRGRVTDLIQQQLLGQREIRVNVSVKGAHGLDIDSDVDAKQLSDLPEAVQRMIGR